MSKQEYHLASVIQHLIFPPELVETKEGLKGEGMFLSFITRDPAIIT